MRKLSIRHWPPISRMAGDLIKFPFSKVKPTIEENNNSEIISVTPWFLLCFGDNSIAFYDNIQKARNAFEYIKHEFVSGEGAGRMDSKGVIEDAINEEIYFGTANILHSKNLLKDIGIEDDKLMEADLNNPIHELYANTIFNFFDNQKWESVRNIIAKEGLDIIKMPNGYNPPGKAILNDVPAIFMDFNLDLPNDVSNKLYTKGVKVSKSLNQVINTLSNVVSKTIKYLE